MNCFKCKMCGGTVEVKDGEKYGICDSCGTTQPLPVQNDSSAEELKSKLKDVVNTGAETVGKAVDSVSREFNNVTSDSEKTKNIVLGVVFLFIFWPVSIYFFIKAFKK